MFKTIFCVRPEATAGVLCLLWWYHAATSILAARQMEPHTQKLNHSGQGNPANERICRHIIKLENLREELPPLLKKYNLDKAGHPETSFWALAFYGKSTCSIDVKILMFPKALPEGIEWIGRQGIATGNKFQRIKHF
jgi:hypothetical protein